MNKTPPSKIKDQLPQGSTVEDIFRIRAFEEPLVPIGGDPTPAENCALINAFYSYSKRSGPEDFSNLTEFLETHPESPWNAGLLTNLGLEYYKTGHYSKALEAWTQAWELAKAATDLKGKALADRAAGELAYMYARLGRKKQLETFLKSIEKRVLCGPATERIVGAREGLWNMQHRPEISFRCGPLSLHRIKLVIHPNEPAKELMDATTSTELGFSLNQVAELSHQVGLNFQMAFRHKGAELILPAVMHLTQDHFAAVIRTERDRYLLQDPTFKDNVWVTKDTIETEGTGYFLVPPREAAKGLESR
jgi:hypothetical protein